MPSTFFFEPFCWYLKRNEGCGLLSAWIFMPRQGIGHLPWCRLGLAAEERGWKWLFRRGLCIPYTSLSLHQAEHKLQLDAAAQRLKWGHPRNVTPSMRQNEQWTNSWNCDPHPWAVFIEPTIDFRMMPVSSSASVDDRSEPFDIQARLTRNVSTFTMWALKKSPRLEMNRNVRFY